MLSSCVLVIDDSGEVDYSYSSQSNTYASEMANKVEDLINASSHIEIYDLEVEASDKDVVMYGEARSIKDIQYAIDVALAVPEVENVVSELSVTIYK